jgi:hypothetical protein
VTKPFEFERLAELIEAGDDETAVRPPRAGRASRRPAAREDRRAPAPKRHRRGP